MTEQLRDELERLSKAVSEAPSENKRYVFGQSWTQIVKGCGFTFEELAQQTRITEKFIAALSKGTFEELPGEIFGRGFIRSACKHMGVPSAALIEAFNDAWAAPSVGSAIIETEQKGIATSTAELSGKSKDADEGATKELVEQDSGVPFEEKSNVDQSKHSPHKDMIGNRDSKVNAATDSLGDVSPGDLTRGLDSDPERIGALQAPGLSGVAVQKSSQGANQIESENIKNAQKSPEHTEPSLSNQPAAGAMGQVARRGVGGKSKSKSKSESEIEKGAPQAHWLRWTTAGFVFAAVVSVLFVVSVDRPVKMTPDTSISKLEKTLRGTTVKQPVKRSSAQSDKKTAAQELESGTDGAVVSFPSSESSNAQLAGQGSNSEGTKVESSSPGDSDKAAQAADISRQPASEVFNGGGQVVVNVKEPVDVRIRIDGGSFTRRRLEVKRYEYTFEKQADFMIYDAAAVDISLNGKPIGPLGSKGRKRRISFVETLKPTQNSSTF